MAALAEQTAHLMLGDLTAHRQIERRQAVL